MDTNGIYQDFRIIQAFSENGYTISMNFIITKIKENKTVFLNFEMDILDINENGE